VGSSPIFRIRERAENLLGKIFFFYLNGDCLQSRNVPFGTYGDYLNLFFEKSEKSKK
jgi:hypothetical protein